MLRWDIWWGESAGAGELGAMGYIYIEDLFYQVFSDMGGVALSGPLFVGHDRLFFGLAPLPQINLYLNMSTSTQIML